MLRNPGLSEFSARCVSFARGRPRVTLAALSTTLLGTVVVAGLASRPDLPASDPQLQASAKTAAALAIDPPLLEPSPALEAQALNRFPSAPLPATFGPSTAPKPAPLERAAASAAKPGPAPDTKAAEARRVAQAPAPARAAQVPPLPVPRPAELRAPDAPKVASRRPARRTKSAVAPAAPDNRSFFEKLFDLPAAAAPSYSALDTAPARTVPAPQLAPSPAPAPQAGVAVYDISARTVTLPNGEKLEAHSGLREKMDDPRFVHLRMRGATPPGTYELTERESLFHGVRAIRMNPVGGSAAIHGRTGILAHSYLLGPRGDSNGCVSFKDYDRFLQAYLRGEIRQLVVVSGRGQDGPGLFGRGFGMSREPAPSAREG